MLHTQSQSWPRAAREQDGFTTIELMVVVAILGVLAALAAPAFNTLIQNWRVRQVSDDFAASFMLARAEAMRRGGGIVVHRNPASNDLCPEVDDSSSAVWSCGWFVFVDADGDGMHDDDEQILRTSHVPRGLAVQRSANSPAYFRLDRWGQASGLGVLGLTVRPPSGSAATGTAICISSGGRIDIRRGASSCTS